MEWGIDVTDKSLAYIQKVLQLPEMGPEIPALVTGLPCWALLTHIIGLDRRKAIQSLLTQAGLTWELASSTIDAAQNALFRKRGDTSKDVYFWDAIVCGKWAFPVTD